MRQDWEPEDLVAAWTLLEDDRQLIANKTGVTRLGFALLLKFFEQEGRFPAGPEEVPRQAVEYVGAQVGVDPNGGEGGVLLISPLAACEGGHEVLARPHLAVAAVRAGVYTRISSDPSGQRAGVARQRADCEEYCVGRGWQVVELFEDNEGS